MPKEVEAMRASMEGRLSSLEKALADPAQHGSLESLILELARIATKEADATARHAVLDAHMAGQQEAAEARNELTAALEAEQVESAALRQVIDGAKLALKQAEAALKDERRAVEAANREAAAVRRELAVAQESLEQTQTGRANERRDIEAALAVAEGDRDAARRDLQAVQGELGTARRELDDIRRDANTRTQTDSESQERHEQALTAANAAVTSAETRLEETVRERDAARNDVETMREELDGVRFLSAFGATPMRGADVLGVAERSGTGVACRAPGCEKRRGAARGGDAGLRGRPERKPKRRRQSQGRRSGGSRVLCGHWRASGCA